MPKALAKPQAPPLSMEQAKEMSDLFDRALTNFNGGADELESAVGMYFLGRHLGWKPLYIIHSKKTVAKYEAILGINVREVFPPEGYGVERSKGYNIALTFSNFWKVVSGDEKVDRLTRREVI